MTPPSNPGSKSPHPTVHSPRWWPAILLLALTLARLVHIWGFKDVERQFKFASTATSLRLILPLALVWFLVFSRLRIRTRILGLAALILTCVVAALCFRTRGVDGDRLPIVEWRWTQLLAPTGISVPSAGLGSPSPSATALPGSADFPQFQGVNRNARMPDVHLGTNWTVSPPSLLWRQPVGEGWSGFSVSGRIALSLEQSEDKEALFALDLATGNRLWSSPYPARYSNPEAGTGPRSVPTIEGGAVYTAGGTGIIRSWDLATGRARWQVDLSKDLGATIPEWGYSASPLVYRGLVWIPCGGVGRSLIALDPATGTLKHGGGDSPAAYSSPITATLGGSDQILCLNAVGLAGHDSANGRLLWEQPIPYAPHVSAPLVLGPDRILVSVGYGKGSFLIGVGRDPSGKWTNGVVWKSIRLKSKFANLVADGETVYGLDDGALVALDLTNGALRWKERRYGHGQMLWAGGRLIIGAENGDVALVEATPSGMHELGRFPALSGKTWNPPALAGHLLLLRNDREAVCFRLDTL